MCPIPTKTSKSFKSQKTFRRKVMMTSKKTVPDICHSQLLPPRRGSPSWDLTTKREAAMANKTAVLRVLSCLFFSRVISNIGSFWWYISPYNSFIISDSTIRSLLFVLVASCQLLLQKLQLPGWSVEAMVEPLQRSKLLFYHTPNMY